MSSTTATTSPTAAFAYLNSRTESTGDEVSADVFEAIAAKIEADPSLLTIPLANIDRWLSQGHSDVVRLEQWRAVLIKARASSAGFNQLLDLLRDQSWEAVFFKEFAPFPGVLSNAELKCFQCTSAH